MLKPVLDFGKQIFSLTRRVQEHEDRFAEVQRQVDDLYGRMEKLNQTVNGLVAELRRHEDVAERDHEILILRLENRLIAFERRLPPASTGDDAT